MAPLLLTSPKSLVSGFAIKPDALCMRPRLRRRVQWRPRQLASLAASSGGRGWEINLLEINFSLSSGSSEQMRWWDRSVQVHYEPCLINTDRIQTGTSHSVRFSQMSNIFIKWSAFLNLQYCRCFLWQFIWFGIFDELGKPDIDASSHHKAIFKINCVIKTF